MIITKMHEQKMKTTAVLSPSNLLSAANEFIYSNIFDLIKSVVVFSRELFEPR